MTAGINVQFHTFPDAETLNQALATDIAADLKAGTATHGKASLIVSGGSTPKPMFQKLRAMELPWKDIFLTMADERWVPVDSEDSNTRLIQENLVTDGVNFITLKNDAATPEAGVAACREALSVIPRPFDVVVLGMGNDGHTASLFPGASHLAAALDPASAEVVSAMYPGHAPHPRMTLTFAELMKARKIILHITGAQKKEVYDRAIAPGPVEEFPIRAFLYQKQVPVHVYWHA
jgi:6-phosphogluconolactonase